MVKGAENIVYVLILRKCLQVLAHIPRLRMRGDQVNFQI